MLSSVFQAKHRWGSSMKLLVLEVGRQYKEEMEITDFLNILVQKEKHLRENLSSNL